jgi:hypothetical protein
MVTSSTMQPSSGGSARARIELLDAEAFVVEDTRERAPHPGIVVNEKYLFHRRPPIDWKATEVAWRARPGR